MTAPDTKAIRAQMEALEGFTPGPWSWDEECPDGYSEWYLRPGVLIVDGSDGTPDGDEIDRANAQIIAAAPDMHATIFALCDALDELRAENERLRAALAPFSEEAAYWFSHNYNREDRPVEGFRGYTPVMTCGDLFNARAALAQKGGASDGKASP